MGAAGGADEKSVPPAQATVAQDTTSNASENNEEEVLFASPFPEKTRGGIARDQASVQVRDFGSASCSGIPYPYDTTQTNLEYVTSLVTLSLRWEQILGCRLSFWAL